MEEENGEAISRLETCTERGEARGHLCSRQGRTRCSDRIGQEQRARQVVGIQEGVQVGWEGGVPWKERAVASLITDEPAELDAGMGPSTLTGMARATMGQVPIANY